MPAHPLAIVRHLAEVMRSPSDHVLSEQVFDYSYDAWMREQIVDFSVFQMRGADRITVAAFGDHARQQLVEITAMRGDLVFVEDADAFEKAVAVERFDLFARKRLRVFDSERMEAQVAFDLIEFRVVGNDFELGCLSHCSLPNFSLQPGIKAGED